jgi:hypothetical protein
MRKQELIAVTVLTVLFALLGVKVINDGLKLMSIKPSTDTECECYAQSRTVAQYEECVK